MARRDLTKALPRRFYTMVSVGGEPGAYGPRLDGRAVRTPAKAPLVVPTQVLAEAIAGEWRAAVEIIDPEVMAADQARQFRDRRGSRARSTRRSRKWPNSPETDLVCYRAGNPEALIAAQSEAWDPVLAFAETSLDARFVCTRGILYVEQPAEARKRVLTAVEAVARGPAGALRLAALSVMTSLTGSVLIALAIGQGAMSAGAAWTTAHVDEDYQMRFWGCLDADALARRDRRWLDMDAAAKLFALAA